MESPELFNYSDYRAYLRDHYEAQKTANVTYSYRLFARRARLSSPNYLKLVIDGKRRITDRNLPCFVRGLKLQGAAAEYFRNLVFFQEAVDAETRQGHLSKMNELRLRARSRVHTLDGDRLELLRSWHHLVIREMTLLADFRNDPVWIAKRLKGRISPEQATESLELLKRLEFLREDKGRLVQSDPLISTTDDVSLLLLRNLHRQFLQFAAEAVMNEPVETREFNSLTLALPRSRLPEFKRYIREFRRETNRRFTQENENEEVFQLQIALYSLTTKGDKK